MIGYSNCLVDHHIDEAGAVIGEGGVQTKEPDLLETIHISRTLRRKICALVRRAKGFLHVRDMASFGDVGRVLIGSTLR